MYIEGGPAPYVIKSLSIYTTIMDYSLQSHMSVLHSDDSSQKTHNIMCETIWISTKLFIKQC